jgi:ABC-type dipeptide/oligopeptide/nickel transport system permease component
VTFLGPATAFLLTGSMVVETIFQIPGIGRYFVQGALNRDYTLVMGVTIVGAAFVILANLIVDMIYAALDPKAAPSTPLAPGFRSSLLRWKFRDANFGNLRALETF